MKMLTLFLLLFAGAAFAQDDTAVEPQSKPADVVLDSVPDLLQTLKKAQFPGGGSQFCAPVCVSNSLVWLEGNLKRNYQIDVVKKLAGEDFMNTSLSTGTGTRALMRGVERYALEHWPDFHRLEYSGWRPAPTQQTVAKTPSLNWMLDGLHNKAAVWVNVGWYNENAENPGVFERVGGHWVTCIGHRDGRLVFHDPAPRAGKRSQREYVTYEVLENGRLTGKKSGLPADATGYIRLGKGMHLSSKANSAIIDGVVIFEINKPEPVRKWVSANGKFSVEARYLSHTTDKVLLQPIDGSKSIKVNLDALSKADQAYVSSKTMK